MNLFRFIPVFITLLFSLPGQAQEELSSARTSPSYRYVHLRLHALEKYNSRLSRQQSSLINKLKKKEKRLGKSLKKKDSTAYARYQQQPVTYDSIRKLSADDSLLAEQNKRPNANVDSLKSIHAFSSARGEIPDKEQSLRVAALGQNLKAKEQVNALLTQRTDYLKGITRKNGSLTSIEKKVFYTKARMRVFKQMSEEPDKAEEQALEYLQGLDGFSAFMNQSNGTPGMAGDLSEKQAQQLGLQVKKKVQADLENKFGSTLSAAAKNAGQGLTNWRSVSAKRAELSSAKELLSNAGKSGKPSFKINPMRGLPFIKRIERQYNWQLSRADGNLPAMLETSGMLGFRHFPKLTYGVGSGIRVGLGKSWQDIHLSFQGITLKSFVEWQLIYRVGLYGGYERTYKTYAFTGKSAAIPDGVLPSQRNNERFEETALAGLSKRYKLNAKYNGSIQLLYNIWWREKGISSPILIRFSTITR